jgi:hypothetical protein
MTNRDATKVRFDLWAVLSFLVVLVGIGMGYLFNAQATARIIVTYKISTFFTAIDS